MCSGARKQCSESEAKTDGRQPENSGQQPVTLRCMCQQRLPLHEFEATLAERLDAQQVALMLYQKEASR